MGTPFLRLLMETGPPFYVVIRATRRLAVCSAKEEPSFLSHFKTLSNGLAPGIEPATSRSVIKRSTDWANPATVKHLRVKSIRHSAVRAPFSALWTDLRNQHGIVPLYRWNEVTITVFSVFTWRHQNSNWETINSSEFLLSWGITAPKHLYVNKFSVRKYSSFCKRGCLNFQAIVWTRHLGSGWERSYVGWKRCRFFEILLSKHSLSQNKY